MNIYENIIILNASLADEEIKSAITKIEEFITGHGGEIVKINIWGKKKLAYEIKKQKRGLYVLLVYKTPPSTIKKLEEFYRVFDAVKKHIIIKLSAKQAKDLEKIEAIPEPVEQKGEV
ncbi:MAG: 30S ribosomal protein S6 [Thermodesulfovibrionales bacterium]|nr:30S ribosomal protein S6 [Thermodesulfovibrionales bacterium]